MPSSAAKRMSSRSRVDSAGAEMPPPWRFSPLRSDSSPPTRTRVSMAVGVTRSTSSTIWPSLSSSVSPAATSCSTTARIVLDVEFMPTTIDTKVRVGGELSDRKGVNRQGGGISAPALTDKDRDDIRLAAEVGVDFLAVSFARDAADIEPGARLLRAAGGTAHLVAKIERPEAIHNLAGIIDASDVVMVARGDLGVEMGYAELTGLQKTIIHETAHAQ